MKKLALLLAVVLIAVPAMADVAIEVVDAGDDWVDIMYTSDDANNIPRAFGLDITVDGATIEGYSLDGAEPFVIYPGSIVIVEGQVDQDGTPIAAASAPGAQPGLGTEGVTIEMGSLYNLEVEEGGEKPADEGLLISLQLSGSGIVNVTANTTRAATGVVLEDVTNAVVDLSLATEVAIGDVEPDCVGDLTGDGIVSADDMNVLLMYLFQNGDPAQGYLTPETPDGYDLTGDGNVSADDMNVLLMHLFQNGDPAQGYLAPCM